jgi:ketosteroid isomerase-like protein
VSGNRVPGNVEKIRRGQEGFSRGDLSPVEDLVADDVEWGALGTFPGVESVYRGREGMARWMEAIRSAWESFEVSVGEVLHDAGDVVVIEEGLRGRGRESGVEVEMTIFSADGFKRGKVVRRLPFSSREDALRAVGAKD